MAADLLPCAWCGAAARTERPHPGCSMVYCSNIDCPVHAGTGWCDESEEAAAVRWNRRAPPLAAPAPSAMATGEDELSEYDELCDKIAEITAGLVVDDGDEPESPTINARIAFLRKLAEQHSATPPAAPAAVTLPLRDLLGFVNATISRETESQPLIDWGYRLQAVLQAAIAAAAASVERG